MGLQFKWPWLLLLIPIAVAYVVFTIRHSARLNGWRKVMAIAIRSLLMMILIFALSGIQSYVSHERQSLVFLVDRSDSMPQQQMLIDWMSEAADGKEEDDRIGIASFGAQALLERHPSAHDVSSWSLNSSINPQFTNIASGLQLAESLDVDDAALRIVLLSDGQENMGDMHKQALLLRNKGIPVDVLITGQTSINDMAIERFDMPEQLYQGEKYSFDVTIQSTYATNAVLRIYEDDVEISQQQVQIERGENRFIMQSVAVHAGLHRYRAEIYATDDVQPLNNVQYAFSQVIGPPKVLVVEGQSEQSQNLLAILDASFIPYDVIVPELLSENSEHYVGYDSIIFTNVPADRVPEHKMTMIEQAVRDFGIGFVMLGGENSFGLGGYLDTPLEKALPVYMDLRGKREIPSLGLVLVIDKSGSMSGERIALAQEAAIRTVELLRDKDTVGVLAFDSTPWWVVQPQQLTVRDEVISAISSIEASGGTEIYDAVAEGLAALRSADAQRKHMILLTDGMSATQRSYSALTADLASENITISTVGIGDGADQQLLQFIAQLGNGRYYFTDEQSNLPEIFSREAMLISRTYIVDDPFVPIVDQARDWQHLFHDGVPTVNAYIATTLKETAEAALISPEPDPLLARWQYGAGRAIAWTSDLSGQWSGDWLQWEALPEVFAEIIKWTFPQFQKSPFQLNTRLEGNRLMLDVKSDATDFHGQLKAVISNGHGEQREVTFVPAIPGEYFAEFEIEEMGAYLTRIDVFERTEATDGQGDGDAAARAEEQQLIGSMTTGFVIPYSPEYKVTTHVETAKLERLAELTGGRILSLERPEEVFQATVQAKRMYYDIMPYMLITVLLLWLVDIANRRLTIPWGRLLSSRRKTDTADHVVAHHRQATASSRASSGEKTMTAHKEELNIEEQEKEGQTSNLGRLGGRLQEIRHKEQRRISTGQQHSKSATTEEQKRGRETTSATNNKFVACHKLEPDSKKVNSSENDRNEGNEPNDDRLSRLLEARKRGRR